MKCFVVHHRKARAAKRSKKKYGAICDCSTLSTTVRKLQSWIVEHCNWKQGPSQQKQQMKLACPRSNKTSLHVRFDQQFLKREEERKEEKKVCATLCFISFQHEYKLIAATFKINYIKCSSKKEMCSCSACHFLFLLFFAFPVSIVDLTEAFEDGGHPEERT